jgi:hypothetical protein
VEHFREQRRIMNKTFWTPTLIWLGAVSVALVLALAAPSESKLMGRMPTLTAKRLDQQLVVLPHGLAADRTLALVAFNRNQRAEIESWVHGLRLEHDAAIPWIRMPVLNDPGNEDARNAIEVRLLARHTSESARARLVPVFTNRDAFIRAAGLSGADHASVLVLDRDGRVLARAEGLFDQDKGQALRETLLAQR